MRERRKAKGVDEMLSCAHVKEKANNQLTILSSIHFLARQGLPFRGHYNQDDSGSDEQNGNFMKLLELRKEDVPVLVPQFISPTIQNEMADKHYASN